MRPQASKSSSARKKTDDNDDKQSSSRATEPSSRSISAKRKKEAKKKRESSTESDSFSIEEAESKDKDDTKAKEAKEKQGRDEHGRFLGSAKKSTTQKQQADEVQSKDENSTGPSTPVARPKSGKKSRDLPSKSQTTSVAKSVEQKSEKSTKKGASSDTPSTPSSPPAISDLKRERRPTSKVRAAQRDAAESEESKKKIATPGSAEAAGPSVGSPPLDTPRQDEKSDAPTQTAIGSSSFRRQSMRQSATGAYPSTHPVEQSASKDPEPKEPKEPDLPEKTEAVVSPSRNDAEPAKSSSSRRPVSQRRSYVHQAKSIPDEQKTDTVPTPALTESVSKESKGESEVKDTAESPSTSRLPVLARQSTSAGKRTKLQVESNSVKALETLEPTLAVVKIAVQPTKPVPRRRSEKKVQPSKNKEEEDKAQADNQIEKTPSSQEEKIDGTSSLPVTPQPSRKRGTSSRASRPGAGGVSSAGSLITSDPPSSSRPSTAGDSTDDIARALKESTDKADGNNIEVPVSPGTPQQSRKRGNSSRANRKEAVTVPASSNDPSTTPSSSDTTLTRKESTTKKAAPQSAKAEDNNAEAPATPVMAPQKTVKTGSSSRGNKRAFVAVSASSSDPSRVRAHSKVRSEKTGDEDTVEPDKAKKASSHDDGQDEAKTSSSSRKKSSPRRPDAKKDANAKDRSASAAKKRERGSSKKTAVAKVDGDKQESQSAQQGTSTGEKKDSELKEAKGDEEELNIIKDSATKKRDRSSHKRAAISKVDKSEDPTVQQETSTSKSKQSDQTEKTEGNDEDLNISKDSVSKKRERSSSKRAAIPEVESDQKEIEGNDEDLDNSRNSKRQRARQEGRKVNDGTTRSISVPTTQETRERQRKEGNEKAPARSRNRTRVSHDELEVPKDEKKEKAVQKQKRSISQGSSDLPTSSSSVFQRDNESSDSEGDQGPSTRRASPRKKQNLQAGNDNEEEADMGSCEPRRSTRPKAKYVVYADSDGEEVEVQEVEVTASSKKRTARKVATKPEEQSDDEAPSIVRTPAKRSKSRREGSDVEEESTSPQSPKPKLSRRKEIVDDSSDSSDEEDELQQPIRTRRSLAAKGSPMEAESSERERARQTRVRTKKVAKAEVTSDEEEEDASLVDSSDEDEEQQKSSNARQKRACAKKIVKAELDSSDEDEEDEEQIIIRPRRSLSARKRSNRMEDESSETEPARPKRECTKKIVKAELSSEEDEEGDDGEPIRIRRPKRACVTAIEVTVNSDGEEEELPIRVLPQRSAKKKGAIQYNEEAETPEEEDSLESTMHEDEEEEITIGDKGKAEDKQSKKPQSPPRRSSQKRKTSADTKKVREAKEDLPSTAEKESQNQLGDGNLDEEVESSLDDDACAAHAKDQADDANPEIPKEDEIVPAEVVDASEASPQKVIAAIPADIIAEDRKKVVPVTKEDVQIRNAIIPRTSQTTSKGENKHIDMNAEIAAALQQQIRVGPTASRKDLQDQPHCSKTTQPKKQPYKRDKPVTLLPPTTSRTPQAQIDSHCSKAQTKNDRNKMAPVTKEDTAKVDRNQIDLDEEIAAALQQQIRDGPTASGKDLQGQPHCSKTQQQKKQPSKRDKSVILLPPTTSRTPQAQISMPQCSTQPKNAQNDRKKVVPVTTEDAQILNAVAPGESQSRKKDVRKKKKAPTRDPVDILELGETSQSLNKRVQQMTKVPETTKDSDNNKRGEASQPSKKKDKSDKKVTEATQNPKNAVLIAGSSQSSKKDVRKNKKVPKNPLPGNDDLVLNIPNRRYKYKLGEWSKPQYHPSPLVRQLGVVETEITSDGEVMEITHTGHTVKHTKRATKKLTEGENKQSALDHSNKEDADEADVAGEDVQAEMVRPTSRMSLSVAESSLVQFVRNKKKKKKNPTKKGTEAEPKGVKTLPIHEFRSGYDEWGFETVILVAHKEDKSPIQQIREMYKKRWRKWRRSQRKRGIPIPLPRKKASRRGVAKSMMSKSKSTPAVEQSQAEAGSSESAVIVHMDSAKEQADDANPEIIENDDTTKKIAVPAEIDDETKGPESADKPGPSGVSNGRNSSKIVRRSVKRKPLLRKKEPFLDKLSRGNVRKLEDNARKRTMEMKRKLREKDGELLRLLTRKARVKQLSLPGFLSTKKYGMYADDYLLVQKKTTTLDLQVCRDGESGKLRLPFLTRNLCFNKNRAFRPIPDFDPAKPPKASVADPNLPLTARILGDRNDMTKREKKNTIMKFLDRQLTGDPMETLNEMYQERGVPENYCFSLATIADYSKNKRSALYFDAQFMRFVEKDWMADKRLRKELETGRAFVKSKLKEAAIEERQQRAIAEERAKEADAAADATVDEDIIIVEDKPDNPIAVKRVVFDLPTVVEVSDDDDCEELDEDRYRTSDPHYQFDISELVALNRKGATPSALRDKFAEEPADWDEYLQMYETFDGLNRQFNEQELVEATKLPKKYTMHELPIDVDKDPHVEGHNVVTIGAGYPHRNTIAVTRLQHSLLTGHRTAYFEFWYQVWAPDGRKSKLFPAHLAVDNHCWTIGSYLPVNEKLLATHPTSLDMRINTFRDVPENGDIHVVVWVTFSGDLSLKDGRGRNSRDKQKAEEYRCTRREEEFAVTPHDRKNADIASFFGTFHLGKSGESRDDHKTWAYGVKSVVLVSESVLDCAKAKEFAMEDGEKTLTPEFANDAVVEIQHVASKAHGTPFLEMEFYNDDIRTRDVTKKSCPLYSGTGTECEHENPQPVSAPRPPRIKIPGWNVKSDRKKIIIKAVGPEPKKPPAKEWGPINVEIESEASSQCDGTESDITEAPVKKAPRRRKRDRSGLPVLDFVKAFSGLDMNFAFETIDELRELVKKNSSIQKELELLIGCKLSKADDTQIASLKLLQRLEFPDVIYYRFPHKAVAESPPVRERSPIRKELLRKPITVRNRWSRKIERQMPFFLVQEAGRRMKIVRVIRWKDVKKMSASDQKIMIANFGKRFDFNTREDWEGNVDDKDPRAIHFLGPNQTLQGFKNARLAEKEARVLHTKAAKLRVYNRKLVKKMEKAKMRQLYANLTRNGYGPRGRPARQRKKPERYGFQPDSDDDWTPEEISPDTVDTGENTQEGSTENTQPSTGASQESAEADGNMDIILPLDAKDAAVGTSGDKKRRSKRIKDNVGTKDATAVPPMKKARVDEAGASRTTAHEIVVPVGKNGALVGWNAESGKRRGKKRPASKTTEKSEPSNGANPKRKRRNQDVKATIRADSPKAPASPQVPPARTPPAERIGLEQTIEEALSDRERPEHAMRTFLNMSVAELRDVVTRQAKIDEWVEDILDTLDPEEADRIRNEWMDKGVNIATWPYDGLTRDQYDDYERKIEDVTKEWMEKEAEMANQPVPTYMDYVYEDYVAKIDGRGGRVHDLPERTPANSQLTYRIKTCTTPNKCILCEKTCRNMFDLLMHYTLTHIRFAFILRPNIQAGKDNMKRLENTLVIDVHLDVDADTTRDLLTHEPRTDKPVNCLTHYDLRKSMKPAKLKSRLTGLALYMTTPMETGLLREMMCMSLLMFTKETLTPSSMRRLEAERVYGKAEHGIMEFDHMYTGPGYMSVLDHHMAFWNRVQAEYYDYHPVHLLKIYLRMALLLQFPAIREYDRMRLFLRCNMHIIKEDAYNEISRVRAAAEEWRLMVKKWLKDVYLGVDVEPLEKPRVRPMRKMLPKLLSHLEELVEERWITYEDQQDLKLRALFHMNDPDFNGDVDKYDPLLDKNHPLRLFFKHNMCEEYSQWKEDLEGRVPKNPRPNPCTMSERALVRAMRERLRRKVGTDYELEKYAESELKRLYGDDAESTTCPEWLFPPKIAFQREDSNPMPTMRVLDRRLGEIAFSSFYYNARVLKKRHDREQRGTEMMKAVLTRHHNQMLVAKILLNESRP